MFRKGHSGNPGGRPKEIGRIRELARAHTEAALKVMVDALSSPKEEIRLKAAEALLDRGYGKPTQSMEHSGPDGEQILVKVNLL